MRRILLTKGSETGDDGRSLIKLAHIAITLGQFQDAVAAFEKVRAMKPPLQETDRLAYAMALNYSKRWDEARGELGRLESDYPKDPTYPYWLGRVELGLQRFEEAKPPLRRAIDKDPDYLKAYGALGRCLENTSAPGEALATFTEAARRNRLLKRPDPVHFVNLGSIHEQSNRLPEAEAAFREAAAAPGSSAPGLFRLGLVLEKQGKTDEAMRALQAATQVSPTYGEPYLALGRLLTRQGRRPEAQAALEQFRKYQRKWPALTTPEPDAIAPLPKP